MAKRKSLNKEKNLLVYSWSDRLGWEYFVFGVTPKELWKKNFRLEETSFFDRVSHLRLTAQTLYITKP